MSRRKGTDSHPKVSSATRRTAQRSKAPAVAMGRSAARSLKIVLKADSQGSLEAIQTALADLGPQGFSVEVIQANPGPVNKSDLLMAVSGDRLVVGFQVGIQPKLDQLSEQQGVEIRLHNVIYSLVQDLRKIMESTEPEPEPPEKILGKARIIALFKAGRKGIIIGCEVQDGKLISGRSYRLISAMGPVHTGKIESLEIDNRPVKEAAAGRQVGIKITDFKKIRIGDQLECFQPMPMPKPSRWVPKGGVVSLVESS